MATTINPGYMGYLEIGTGGSKIRFNDASIVAKQGVSAPDLVTGDWNHDAFNYEKISVGGSVSGPMFDGFETDVFDWAVRRSNTCGTLTEKTVNVYYFCGTGGRGSTCLTNALVNSISVNCSAGDVAQWSMEVIASGNTVIGSPASSTYTTIQKLITWDKCNAKITGITGAVQSFDLTIANNIEAIYAMDDDVDYYPYALVPGMRTITGSLTYFNVPTADGYDNWDSTPTTTTNVTFSLGGTTVTVKAMIHRVEPKASVGPITSTIAFTGVGPQTSLD